MSSVTNFLDERIAKLVRDAKPPAPLPVVVKAAGNEVMRGDWHDALFVLGFNRLVQDHGAVTIERGNK